MVQIPIHATSYKIPSVIPVDLLNVAVQTAFIPPDSSSDNGLSLNPHNSPAPSTQHPTPPRDTIPHSSPRLQGFPDEPESKQRRVSRS